MTFSVFTKRTDAQPVATFETYAEAESFLRENRCEKMADNTVREVRTWRLSKDEAEGRVMDAAPQLLAALKAVVRVADRKTDEFDLARAAIAKAEGRA